MVSETPCSRPARRYERVARPKGITVTWYWAGTGEQQVSSVKAIGMGGMFLSVSHARVVGTALKLISVVPEGIFQAEAIVRNVWPGQGMGVEFTKMEPADRALLEKLLKQLTH